MNKNTTAQENEMTRYTIVKLTRGYALFDSTINSTVAGTRCTTKREVKEAAAEIGITVK